MKFGFSRRSFLVSTVAAASASPADGASDKLEPFFQPGKIRALIISGRNNHDWRSTTPFLRKILTDTGLFDVRVVDEAIGLTLDSVMPYHVIVLNYCGPRWGENAEHAVGSAVRGGRGLVVVHGASYAFGEREVLGDNHARTGIKERPWGDYFEMTGATWTEESGHGKRHVFDVKLTGGDHPVTHGVSASFPISDELYHRLKVKEGLNVLATAFSDKTTGGTGQDEPMLWTLRYGKGRVFHTALGHDVAAMTAGGFVTTFARGAEWTATGKVTLPAAMTAAAPKKDPVRVQLVVGGHDFAPSVFQVFDDKPDLETNVVYQPAAYSAGRLENSDVVVQYDMMQTISDTHKANLRQYLESGKGLVVLHHAAVSYQDWEWWWKQVVGGRYVAKDAGDMPPSSFKHDIWMKTETVAEHPVTKGVPPMLIYDEGYKDVWFSPQIKTLIRTGHPSADGPLAWISPYEKARVVVILLGHGPEAHHHPDFQRLVHNAILWTANRES